ERLAGSAPAERDAADRAERDAPLREAAGRTSAGSGDIAVIGMAFRFPGASNREQFWRLLAEGGDAIRPFPEARARDAREYLSLMGREEGASRFVEGGYLDDIAGFDCPFFKISPREAALMDPNQRLFLECC